MTTPRIDELRKLKTIPLNETYYREKTTYYSEKAVLQALTEAHQAGIDEAVEIVESRKQEQVTDNLPPMTYAYNKALNDTIKALQNNK